MTGQDWQRAGAFLALGAVFAVALYWHQAEINQSRQLAAQGKEAHDAICVLKADLLRRAAQSEAFLATHPQPVLLGVPRKTIVDSMRNQHRTVRALHNVVCEDTP